MASWPPLQAGGSTGSAVAARRQARTKAAERCQSPGAFAAWRVFRRAPFCGRELRTASTAAPAWARWGLGTRATSTTGEDWQQARAGRSGLFWLCAPDDPRRFQCSSQTLTQRRCSRTHGLRLQSPFHPHARGHRNAAPFPGSPRPASRGDADWVSSDSSCASSRVSESSAPPCGERAEAVAVGESSPPEAAAAVLG